jgi:hypothetical protein
MGILHQTILSSIASAEVIGSIIMCLKDGRNSHKRDIPVRLRAVRPHSLFGLPSIFCCILATTPRVQVIQLFITNI